MGEASRRKDLVEDVRKKIGAEAAAVVGGLHQELQQLKAQHQAFVFEIEGLRREVAAAKAAPAELRRDVRSFHGDLAMKTENIENLELRVQTIERTRHTENLDRRVQALETLYAQVAPPKIRASLLGRLRWRLRRAFRGSR